MAQWVLIAVLMAVILLQMIHTHRLVNKLMSRNYFEYNQAVNQSSAPSIRIPTEHEPAEDFGILNDI